MVTIIFPRPIYGGIQALCAFSPAPPQLRSLQGVSSYIALP